MMHLGSWEVLAGIMSQPQLLMQQKEQIFNLTSQNAQIIKY